MPSESPSPEFRAAFCERADSRGIMDYSGFVELALYHPTLGYYRRRQRRIGREIGTDFFTANTMNPVFSELVTRSAAALLAGRGEPQEFNFVEIGAEPLTGEPVAGPGPFQVRRALRLGDSLDLSGPSVVFSNELFDAQPFRRLVYRRGAWRELGVRCLDNQLEQIELDEPPELTGPLAPLADGGDWPEDYHLDAPLGAAALAVRLVRPGWNGLFLAFDYGKSWRELSGATPAGTARAYHRHRQSNDLLARPGEQDLTCHICWDWLVDALAGSGFTTPVLESQEEFFVRHAGDFLASVVSAEAGRFSPMKSALMGLIHPGNFGQKFQVLHAFRSAG